MESSVQPIRNISLIEAAALSVALIGPTLVLAANAQTVALEIQQPLWLVFAVGLIGIAAVGYAFVRLLPLTGGPGSAYLTVQATLGHVVGQLAGVALLGAYLSFSVATPAAIVSFIDTIAPSLGQDSNVGPRLIMTTVAMVAAAFIVTRPNVAIMRLLLIVEVLGMGLIAVLAVSVLGSTAAPAPTAAAEIQTSVWHLLDGVSVSFLSWAGFESCMTMAGNAKNPQRDMPLALGLSVALSAILFVGMMAIIEHGFNTRLGGRAALAVSGNALADLGTAYLGRWGGTGFGVASVGSAFACMIAAISAAGSIFGSLVPGAARPGRVLSLPLLIVGGVWLFECGWAVTSPLASVVTSPIALYGLFGTCGAVCIMVAYLLVLAGYLKAVLTGQLRVSGWEILIPIVGLVFLGAALVDTVLTPGATAISTLFAACWCVVGLGVAMGAPVLSRRMHEPT